MKTILITGGAGFIGSEFVRQAIKRGYKVDVVDCITYAGDKARLFRGRQNMTPLRGRQNTIPSPLVGEGEGGGSSLRPF